jgi:ATP-dependent RNA circularization protein (DNA/RNA ligase family)
MSDDFSRHLLQYVNCLSEYENIRKICVGVSIYIHAPRVFMLQRIICTELRLKFCLIMQAAFESTFEELLWNLAS